MDPYSVRMNTLRDKIAVNGLKGVILVPGPNLRYYTGGHSLLLERPFFLAIPLDGDPQMVTPTLEAGPYVNCPLKIMIHSWSDADGPSKAIQEAVSMLDLNGKWGLEGDMPYGFIDWIFRYAKPDFANAHQILQNIRAIKDPDEVKRLTKAAAILSKSFLKIPHLLKAGKSEVELSQAISSQIYSNGADSVPDALVQTGPMAADGHHLPSARKLRRKESVVVDATCTYEGYFADITRTFILGKDETFQRLYEELLEAQVAAVKASKAEETVGSVDEAARGHLRQKNLDGYFNHRTGHGLGLEVHEAPYIIPDGTERLLPSMAFTVEPGVYMPGKTGLRIEDDLVTKGDGSIVLTKSVPKEYDWWS